MHRQPILQSVVIGAFLALVWNTAAPQMPAAASGIASDVAVTQNAPAIIDPFADIAIQARSFLVSDLSSGAPQTIAGRESTLQWPLASVTKLATAVIASENIPADAEVKITAAAVAERGDDGLLVGERFVRDDLLDLMLVRSSNDAARAFADTLGYEKFLQLMNDKAKALGMTQTYFLNPNGLDVGVSTSGAYSSAEDLAKLAAYILNTAPQLFSATERPEFSVRSLSGKAHGYPNTNKLVDNLPQLIGGKTGLTDIAGGNLLVIVDIGVNHPVLIIVLGSTESGRFDDVRALYDATLKYFQNK
ncbi:MAG: D-alanyl-D-alanine carboxypeptidase [Candidatus Niyogibacteria bacterium]|nr:D-alanyl-D-alanine carboxypeptidase [Candidatus Niyogibacteria bacterium]